MKVTEGDAGNDADPGSDPAGFTAHCSQCRRESVFIRARVSNRRHLLLSLVTGGLWLIVWLALLLGKCLRPWRCSVCGWHKPEFRKTIPAPAKKVQPPTVE